MSNFIKIIPIALLVTALAVFISYFNQPSPQASPGPTINWTPIKITETISPSDSKLVGVSFVPDKDLNNVVVFVVPELQPYVEVNPNSFAHVSAGAPIVLTIEFSAPFAAELGNFEGSIHIKNSRTYPKPLPINLNIWDKLTSEEGEFSINYPPGAVISHIDSPAPDEAPEIFAERITTPGGSKFLLFPLGGYGYGLDDELNEIINPIVVGGFNAFRKDFRRQDGMLALTRIEFVDVPGAPDFRIEFRNVNSEELPLLETMLNSLIIW